MKNHPLFFFVLIAIIVIVLDGIYLSTIGKMYNRTVLQIQKSPLCLNYKAMVMTYLLIIHGLYFLIIHKHFTPLETGIVGLLVYGVFDLTTKTIFKNYPWNLVLIDSAWGFALFYATSYLIRKIKNV